MHYCSIPIEKRINYIRNSVKVVIVAYENDVVMEENLERALQRLFGMKTVAGKADRTAKDVPLSTAELAKEAMRVYGQAIEFQRQGNWSGYGEEMNKLEQIFKMMAR